MNILKRRWIRWSLRALVIGLVLAGLFRVWVNRWGARRWRETQAMLAREGQTLDLRAIGPGPIPDAENFCAIPLLKDLALVIDGDRHKGAPAQKRELLMSSTLPYSGAKTAMPMLGRIDLGRRTDFMEWSRWARSRSSQPIPDVPRDAVTLVLAELSKQHAIFDELASGLDRPRSQWTPAWNIRKSLDEHPHLYTFYGISENLALCGLAEAALGNVARAHQHLQIIARLSQACLEEPSREAEWYAEVEARILADATWELCDAHVGTAEDFRRLESVFTEMDFRPAIARAASGSLISGVEEIQSTKKDPDEILLITGVKRYRSGGASWYQRIKARAVLAGLIDANSAVCAARALVYSVKPIRDSGWMAALAAARAVEKEEPKTREDFYTAPLSFLAATFSPEGPYRLRYSIYAQTLVNQAAIACALEQYRIEKGSYPDTLEGVRLADGKPLPVEVLTRKPMSYRRAANGKYALWSSALRGINHGGVRVINKEKPEKTRFYREDYAGDWVWDFPEK